MKKKQKEVREKAGEDFANYESADWPPLDVPVVDGHRQYAVSGNKDQIEKNENMKEFTFINVDPRNPNRVVTYFYNKHDAVNLYFGMTALGMVALKNWV